MDVIVRGIVKIKGKSHQSDLNLDRGVLNLTAEEMDKFMDLTTVAMVKGGL